MNGMNNVTGQALTGMDHIIQSIRDILTTPIGTRLMRPNYGSRIFEYIDAPMTDETKIQMIAATAEAIGKWEPRVEVKRVQVEPTASGRMTIKIELSNNENIAVSI